MRDKHAVLYRAAAMDMDNVSGFFNNAMGAEKFTFMKSRLLPATEQPAVTPNNEQSSN